MTNPASNHERSSGGLNALLTHSTGPLTLITLATLGHFKEERFTTTELRNHIEEFQKEDVAWVPHLKTIRNTLEMMTTDPQLVDQPWTANRPIKRPYQISPLGLYKAMPPAVTILDWWTQNPDFSPPKIFGNSGRGPDAALMRLNLLGKLCKTEDSINTKRLRPTAGTTSHAFGNLADKLASDGLLDIHDKDTNDRLLSCSQKARLPLQNLFDRLVTPLPHEDSAALAEDLLLAPGRFSGLMRMARLCVNN